MALNAVSAGFADTRCALLPLFVQAPLRFACFSLTMTTFPACDSLLYRPFAYCRTARCCPGALLPFCVLVELPFASPSRSMTTIRSAAAYRVGHSHGGEVLRRNHVFVKNVVGCEVFYGRGWHKPSAISEQSLSSIHSAQSLACARFSNSTIAGELGPDGAYGS
jgi:hypothetical protein